MKWIAPIIILVSTLAIVGMYFFVPDEESASDLPIAKEKETHQPNIPVITGLKTCDVCGYDALVQKGDICQNCGFEISEEAAAIEHVASKEELVVIRQVEYFMPDTLGTSVDFLSPSVSEKGYPKNLNWRPRVYESQIYEIQKAMLEAEKNKSIQEETESSLHVH